MKLSGFRTIKQSSESFKEFADDWQKHRVITGIKDLDDAVRMLPTGLVIINAKPGIGKTSLSLNLMQNCAREGKNVLFYSIDMVEDEFFTKSKSKALRISPDEVMDLYFNKDEEALALQAEGDKLTEEMLQNVFINYDARLTPEKIDADLTAFKEAGVTIHLVIIDYLQKMEGCGDFTSPRIGTNLMGLKALQPKHKVCIIGLSQMPRAGGNEETPVLTAAAAKGGGVYEENASVVINLWRPMKFYRNENGNQDNYLGYMVAKNRLGQCKEGVFHFKGAISEIRSMTDQEKEDYEILKEERKQREQPKISRGFSNA
jgi:replicative DNA helicase